MNKCNFVTLCVAAALLGCSKGSSGPVEPPLPVPGPFNFKTLEVNGVNSGYNYHGVPVNSIIKFTFSAPVDHASVASGVTYKTKYGVAVNYTASYENGDSTLVLTPAAALANITHYDVALTTNLKSKDAVALKLPVNLAVATVLDSTDKFTRITDSALLDLVQKQTFKYFGILATRLAVWRGKEIRQAIFALPGNGLRHNVHHCCSEQEFHYTNRRIATHTKDREFYKNNCTAFHGAYAHWINGATGATVPFSTKDDGADLVETSYLMQGLLCARQYFNTTDAKETLLRNDINTLWNAVDFNWFQKVTKMFCIGIGARITIGT